MNNSYFKSLIKEISTHASKGRMIFEADDDQTDDPLSTTDSDQADTDPMAGGDPLAGGDAATGGFGGMDDMGGDMDGLGDEPEDAVDAAETEKVEAETEKAKAEADVAKAEADAAKAEAEKEKSAAEREKAEAQADEFNGIDVFSRPGVSFLVGQLLDDYSKENKVDQLAQQFVSKLRLDDEGFQKFKSQSGPLLKLKGFQQLLNRMESMLHTTADDDIEAAVEK